MTVKLSAIKLTLCLAIIIIASYPLAKEIVKNEKIKQEISNMEQQIENLKKDNEKMETKIQNMDKNEFIELESKEKLNFKKEGEEVIIIPQSGQTTTDQDIKNLQPQSWKDKIIEFLGL